MDSILSEGIKNLIKVLNLHDVRYMLVGGVAVGYYAKPRVSTNLPSGIDYDIDIWYSATTKNFTNLINAIETIRPELGDDLSKIVFNPTSTFLKFNLSNFNFDFLPELAPFAHKDFNACYKKRATTKIDNIEISIISKEGLVMNKTVTDRPKDREDIKNLNKNSFKGFSR